MSCFWREDAIFRPLLYCFFFYTQHCMAQTTNHSDSYIASLLEVTKYLLCKLANKLEASDGNVSCCQKKEIFEAFIHLINQDFINNEPNIIDALRIKPDTSKSKRSIDGHLKVAESASRSLVQDDIRYKTLILSV